MADRDVTLTVLNADEIMRAFQAEAKKMQDTVLKKMATAAAGPVVDRASELAPRRTGFLSENIEAGRVGMKDGRAVVDVGPTRNAFYGRFAEFGTKEQSAQPFLRPAIDEMQGEASDAAKAIVRRELGL